MLEFPAEITFISSMAQIRSMRKSRRKRPRNRKLKTTNRFYISVVIIALIFANLAISSYTQTYTGQAISKQSDTEAFARCLTSRGVVMYGHGQEESTMLQKQMFGNTFWYVNYVDCERQTEYCESKGISSFVTWEKNGKKFGGALDFKDLSLISGC